MTHQPTSERKEKYSLSKKDYVLYLAYLIWHLRKEINDHLEISAKAGKEDFHKHFDIHQCNYDSSRVLMQVIHRWFPENIHPKESINSHFEWAETYIKEKLAKGNKTSNYKLEKGKER